jgi:hypothetical protein
VIAGAHWSRTSASLLLVVMIFTLH